jgi:hypothetical protein
VRQAQAAVLEAARRVLPQQRRSQLSTQHKRASVAAHRERRRRPDGSSGSSGSGSKPSQSTAATAAAAGSDEVSDKEDEDEEAEIELEDVPDEVTRVILASLDPVSIGRAACVCRGWRAMVAADAQLWTRAVRRVFQWRGEDRIREAAAAAGGLEGAEAAAPAAAAAPGGRGRRGGAGDAGGGPDPPQLSPAALAAVFRSLAAGGSAEGARRTRQNPTLPGL